MLNMIKGKYFKGIELFEQPLSRLNLIIGPNGIGKSARSHAISLLFQGYITGIPKTNPAIHAACAPVGTEKIFIQATAENKTEFLKRYAKDPASGAVSCDTMINGRKATASVYASEVERAGGMAVMDLTAFMALSDKKKIDEIFALFPPERGLKDLESKLEQAKSSLNQAQSRMRDNEKLAARLSQSKSSIDRPVGTLAEIKAQLEETEAELKVALNDLRQTEIEQAKETAAEQAKQKAEANAQMEIENAKNQEWLAASVAAEARAEAEKQKKIAQAETRLRKFAESQGRSIDPPPPGPDPLESLKTILDVLQRSGCAACAAILAVKREMKKFRPAVPAGDERMVVNG